VALEDVYVEHGFDPQGNPSQIYAKLKDAVGLALDSSRAGPLTPAMSVVALSRTLGPVGGDLNTLKAGTYDAAEMFRQAATTPRIMGGVKLSDIIPAVPLRGDTAPDEAMVLTTERASKPAAGSALARRGGGSLAPPPEGYGSITRFRWRPKLVSDPIKLLQFYDHTFCQVDLEIRVDFSGGGDEPHTRFQGLLSNAKPWGLISDLPDNTDPGPLVTNKPAMTLRLLGDIETFLEVDFTKFVFQMETGKDVDVNPVLGEIRFLGALKAIQKLKDSLTSLSPPGFPKLGYIVRPVGDSLEVGLKASELSVTLGAFTLKNLMVGITVTFPLMATGNDKPRPVRFNFYFAERADPFLLAVYCFGGGGFVVIGFGTDGMEWFEIALEFGIHAEPTVGIASGVLEIMAGIYLRLDVTPHGQQTCVLTGYLRGRGQLSVIGLVTIALEVYLGLTYESATNQITGQATVTLEIDVLFFSMSVGFHVERKFKCDSQQAAGLRGQPASLAAGDRGPGFLDLIPTQDVWNDYADAFAPVAA
jgi:hypothetical protein